MMERFQVQVDATEPNKWRMVTARDHGHAAAQAAVLFAAPGEHMVYVCGPKNHRYPNGTPLEVHGFRSNHSKKVEPVTS